MNARWSRDYVKIDGTISPREVVILFSYHVTDSSESWHSIITRYIIMLSIFDYIADNDWSLIVLSIFDYREF